MLAFLKILDDISSLTIVRWGMMLVIIALTTTLVIDSIKLKGRELQIANLKADSAKVTAVLSVQNEQIKALGATADAQKEAVQQAASRASQIAVENKRLVDQLGKITLKGTCDEKVVQTLNILNSAK